MHPDESDDVDRALKGLPAPHAPRTLLPRVMAAAELRAARSAPRPWVDWPLAWQLASAALVLLFVVGIARMWPSAQSAIESMATPVVASVSSHVGNVTERASVAVTLTRTIWRLLLQPLSGYALALVLVMGAACATFGAALDRVALGGHT
jgi:hypothetical protein